MAAQWQGSKGGAPAGAHQHISVVHFGDVKTAPDGSRSAKRWCKQEKCCTWLCETAPGCTTAVAARARVQPATWANCKANFLHLLHAKHDRQQAQIPHRAAVLINVHGLAEYASVAPMRPLSRSRAAICGQGVGVRRRCWQIQTPRTRTPTGGVSARACRHHCSAHCGAAGPQQQCPQCR